VAYQERIDGRFQIRTIPITGGTPKLLTSDGENEQPSWAPDARHLVFTSTRTGVRQLWVLDSESGRLRQLTRSGGSRLAAWSPRLDGTR
jgi:TolB protein